MASSTPAGPSSASPAGVDSARAVEADLVELERIGGQPMLLGRLILDPTPEERLEEEAALKLDEALEAPPQER